MELIKKCFNRVVGWLAWPFSKLTHLAMEYTVPLYAQLKGVKGIKWTAGIIAKTVLGMGLVFALGLAIAGGIILAITGLTLLLGLILPSLLANVIAVFGTMYLAYSVGEVVRAELPAEIVAEVEIEA
jgi:hypothetical protein